MKKLKTQFFLPAAFSKKILGRIALLLGSLFFFNISASADTPPGKAPTPPPLCIEEPIPPEMSGMPVDTYQHALLKMLIAFFVLLVLIFVVVWALRRLSQGRLRSMANRSSIKILERRPISPKSILYRVEVSGKEFLISESQFEVRCLAAISEEQPLATKQEE